MKSRLCSGIERWSNVKLKRFIPVTALSPVQDSKPLYEQGRRIAFMYKSVLYRSHFTKEEKKKTFHDSVV